MEQGRFREDLYYRLKVVTLHLPTLRDRPDDIPALVDYFLKRFSHEIGINNPGISKEALNNLMVYTWPGNIRELCNTIHKALIFNRGAPVSPEDISQVFGAGDTGNAEKPESSGKQIRQWVRTKLNSHKNDSLFESIVDDLTAIVLEEALNLTGGNRSHAAKLLGLSRPTLHSKIEKFGIKFETSVRGS